MAKKSKIVKSNREQKYQTRNFNACENCGRVRGYMRKYKLCRICFREFANKGEIPGIQKSSW